MLSKRRTGCVREHISRPPSSGDLFRLGRLDLGNSATKSLLQPQATAFGSSHLTTIFNALFHSSKESRMAMQTTALIFRIECGW